MTTLLIYFALEVALISNSYVSDTLEVSDTYVNFTEVLIIKTYSMSYDTKIACPKCNWEPDGGEYWGCSACGHIWDTFKTTGVCPACQKRHKHTQCIGHAGGCNVSSLHVNWYREIDRNLKEEIEKIEKLIPAEVS